VAKLFDGDGDGLADLIGCPPGWGCEAVIEFHLDAYGLRDTVEHIQGDFTAIHVDAVTRAKAGQSVLYYTYTPLWLGQILVAGKDVEWLSVTETKLPPEQMTDNTLAPDGRNLGWAMNDIRITASNAFLADNPAAAKLFEVMSIPIADVNAQNLLVYEGQKANEDIRRHAEEWVAANAATVEGWVAEAMAATK
jgi:glycine betaine/proline transport system substrate-binding protein